MENERDEAHNEHDDEEGPSNSAGEDGVDKPRCKAGLHERRRDNANADDHHDDLPGNALVVLLLGKQANTRNKGDEREDETHHHRVDGRNPGASHVQAKADNKPDDELDLVSRKLAEVGGLLGNSLDCLVGYRLNLKHLSCIEARQEAANDSERHADDTPVEERHLNTHKLINHRHGQHVQ